MPPIRNVLLTTLVAAALLAAAPSAQAVYKMTPLYLTSSTGHAQVGDEVRFDLAPGEETDPTKYAGKTVTLHYQWNRNEGTQQDGDWTEVPLAPVTLDDASKASYAWTIPQELDDRNVIVRALDDAGNELAVVHFIVGDAEAMMFTMSGSGPSDLESGAPEEGTNPDFEDVKRTDDKAKNTVPGLGILALLGVAALGAIFLARRK